MCCGGGCGGEEGGKGPTWRMCEGQVHHTKKSVCVFVWFGGGMRVCVRACREGVIAGFRIKVLGRVLQVA
jgi:hypothetical protein